MRRSTSTLLAVTAVGAVGVGGWALAPALAAPTSVQTAASAAATESAKPTPSSSPTAGADRQAARKERMESRVKESLADLVKDGTLTQAQADKVASTLAADMGTGMKGGPGNGLRGPGGHKMMMRGGGEAFSAAAKTLKLSEDELRTKLADSSLGEVADQQKVSRTTLVDAMVKAATADINEKVTEGDVTREQADARIATLKERFTSMLDHKMPGGGRPGD